MVVSHNPQNSKLSSGLNLLTNTGGVAQMVERSLSMREVRGSMPRTSIFELSVVLLVWVSS